MTSRNNTSRNYDNNPPPSLRAPNPQNPPPVRRNIFSSHPRRPAATSSLSTATSSASQNVHSDASVSAKEGIIIRDEAGDFRLELPAPGLPPMREDQKEDYSAENRLIEQYYTHRHQIDITGASAISYVKPSPFSHKRQRTLSNDDDEVQAPVQHETCPSCGWPSHKTKQEWENAADCRAALHQLLTQKLHNNVLSLDEDKWMFGEEDGPTS
ncbi:hypothetical protein BLS_009659 [Venturia inaequalis]|uniref:Uncharacterized protein n=1 Tax=Venturia inaequalis TaxID=5025 RepID=A0A8H3Z8T9_VENIN|nr:hypothetical protein EG328_009623 [Venturia inaequalis]KAE9985181.1 hypothetical protein BLS_009659 [Venturia inaequalis]KAE9993206.1 hypothetical protein EG327_006007 [Venturia inaequalis]RDI86539.1 hypothetical protein Vi05172_g3553 [Venturia inaequalis]